jgi:phosphorylcholine metabolism protein LicD
MIKIKSIDECAINVFKNITIVREDKNIRVPAVWADSKRVKTLLQNSQLFEKPKIPLIFVYPTKFVPNKSSKYIAVILSESQEDINQIIDQIPDQPSFQIRKINRDIDYLDIISVKENILTTQIKFSILL